jgi:F-type H+-transporting ATPase subunit epsilon
MAEETTQFRVRLVTPERTLFEQLADTVMLPSKSGEIEVMYGHAPLLAELGAGDVIVQGGPDGEKHYNVSWGFVEVLPERVTILANHAQKPEEIDLPAAEQLLERALAQFQSADDSIESIDASMKVIAEAEARIASAGGGVH